MGNAIRCAVFAMALDFERLLVPKSPGRDSIHEANDYCRISLFLGNTLYAVALGYYTVICFLGYNGLYNPQTIAKILPLV